MEDHEILKDLNSVCDGWERVVGQLAAYYRLGGDADGYHITVDDQRDFDGRGFTASGYFKKRPIFHSPDGIEYERPSLAVMVLRDFLREKVRRSYALRFLQVLGDDEHEGLHERLAEADQINARLCVALGSIIGRAACLQDPAGPGSDRSCRAVIPDRRDRWCLGCIAFEALHGAASGAQE